MYIGTAGVLNIASYKHNIGIYIYLLDLYFNYYFMNTQYHEYNSARVSILHIYVHCI